MHHICKNFISFSGDWQKKKYPNSVKKSGEKVKKSLASVKTVRKVAYKSS